MARQYKLARKMKKITLTAAARELGVTQPALSSWESERKAPSIEALIRMAKFYGVTTDFLLGFLRKPIQEKNGWHQLILRLFRFYTKHQYSLQLVAGRSLMQ